MSDAPIRLAFPDEGFAGNACGCCEGIGFATPRRVTNRANLSAIAFRHGDHGAFKSSMLASLSGADKPALADLGTREDDDFSIALIDAWASVLEVLSFYQERLANEAYIETATERLSITELARLIGYRLHPGAAAETDLVLLLDDPPGAPPDVGALTIPVGTRVQSQPGPGESAQVFETVEPVEARVEWNALTARLSEPKLPLSSSQSAWLLGTPNLSRGDALLFVGGERLSDETSSAWAMRSVRSVTPSDDGERTLVVWDGVLNFTVGNNLQVFALRERASLFGYNAPDPRVFSEDQMTQFGSDIDGDEWDFAFPLAADEAGAHGNVPLDASYKTFLEDGWFVLAAGASDRSLYRIDRVFESGLSAYALSGKSTFLQPDTDADLSGFESAYRRVAVFGGSEELTLAEVPIEDGVSGTEIELAGLAQDLPAGRQLIVAGPRAQLVVATSLQLLSATAPPRTLTAGARLTALAAPIFFVVPSGLPFPFPPVLPRFFFRLRDLDGLEGFTITAPADLEPIAADDTAETIAESATLERIEAADTTHSRIVLAEALGALYDRTGLRVHANVTRAAHGEGVTEILGGGDPSVPFQAFRLGQSPVTHRLAPTETGVESTLTVRIDGVEWEEVPDLYDRAASARVFRTVLTDEGETIVEFGDGRSGARPPPGRDNIVADFSRDLGLAGNLPAGRLKMPLDRPLGLRETNNPLPATGGDDPEARADARRNAPISTLTLGRVVSITDYRDFALGYPGIAKAEARWVWVGDRRRVVVTVAGPGGETLPEGHATYDALLAAYQTLGDPLVAVDLLSFDPVTFGLALKVAVDPAYESEVVLAATEAALREAFSFEARDFARNVALSDVAAAAHSVPGVLAIDVDALYRTTAPQTAQKAHDILIALPGRFANSGAVLPAEILTLSPDPLDSLTVMA